MKVRRASWLCAVVTTMVCGSGLATRSWAQSIEHEIGVGAGAVQFDLSGTGTAFGGTFRATWALSDRLGLQGAVLVARPAEDVGRTTLLIPEVQLQYHWGTGRLRPYAGGGLGAALQDRGALERSDLTLSGAAGVRVLVKARTALFAEFRLRGVEPDFAGSTAEWSGGLSWMLPR